MPKSRGDIVLAWEKLVAALRANPQVLTAVEPLLQEFETLLAEIRMLVVQQAAQTAMVQQTAKDIDERVKRGTLVAGRLRSAAKAVYGDRTEKVIEFGMHPFRKPVRTKKKPVDPPALAKEDATEATKPTT
ncbi:MAG TPA: hypothetical protein VEW48_03505 [Thermoanaerobaculia bacterium]|nr:hypothetical protein [Thermoanaerobaculia bacterium]